MLIERRSPPEQTTCPYCQKLVSFRWDNGFVSEPHNVLIVGWVYHSECWNKQVALHPPSPPASIEAMVDELLPTIMHPEWAGNILAIGKLHKLISAFAARVAAEQRVQCAEIVKTFPMDIDFDDLAISAMASDEIAQIVANRDAAMSEAIRQSASEGKGTDNG